ncbi:MAG TPA: Hpt domain-containing protein [Gammaproteobacteria bacterium]|nr:Hpt domain-containing protein [Gammaproteobacteria bacterium]
MTSESPDSLEAALRALRPEIREMLAEDLPADQRSAEQAFAAAQWDSLQSYVHRINGSASFCHLADLKAVCSRIEAGLKQQQLPDQGAMRDFAREIGRVVMALATVDPV